MCSDDTFAVAREAVRLRLEKTATGQDKPKG